jgi:hypothetical protein
MGTQWFCRTTAPPMTFSDFVTLARQLTIRAFTADFQREQASPSERAELLTGPKPIGDSLAHDYVAWRRAALWVSAALLSLGVLLALFDFSSSAHQMASASNPAPSDDQVRQVEQMFGAGNLHLLDGLQIFLLLVKVTVAALVLVAAMQWKRVDSSRSFARWAWLSALIVPLLVSAWPWGQYLDFSHLDNNSWGGVAERGAMAKQQVSVVIGAMLMVTVTPKLLALFPGIMRSSLALKTLLPQAAAPGWLTVVFAPFLAGFLLLVLCFMSQVQGSWVLIAGVLCLAVGPCIYVKRARDLVRPHTDQEVGGVVRDIRRQALTFHLVGGLLLFVYFLDLDWMPWLTATHLLLEAIGGLLLTMVAISDITLALLAFSHRQGTVFHSSALLKAHEARLQALGTAGLTDIHAVLSMTAGKQPESMPAAAPATRNSGIETMVSSMPPRH